MKLKSNIDFGMAFEYLKKELAKADVIKMDVNDGYVKAYAHLAGTVEGLIENVSEPTETIQDIPSDLFISPSLSKKLDEEEVKTID